MINLEIIGTHTEMSDIKNYINEYIEFTKQNISSLRIKVETDMIDRSFDIFVLDLKNNLIPSNKLEIANLKNTLLQSDKNYLQDLVTTLSTKRA